MFALHDKGTSAYRPQREGDRHCAQQQDAGLVQQCVSLGSVRHPGGTMLRLRDIMTTELVTVSPELSLRDAMELLVTSHVSGAPVVAQHRVVGVVSATDLLGFAAATRFPRRNTAERRIGGARVRRRVWRG